MAGTDVEPFLGLPSGTICRLASADSYPALLRGDLLVPPGLSQGVRFSELRACTKCVGSLSQGRCQTLCGLPGVMCRALGVSLAVGGLPLGRGLLPATLGLLTHMLLLEPPEAFPLSLRVAQRSGFLTLVG